MDSSGAVEALFIGGPKDGQREVIADYPFDILCFERPDFTIYEFGSDRPIPLEPLIRIYKRVANTPSGIAVYEVEPLPKPNCKMVFSVEVDVANGADPELVERVLSDCLKHIDGHVSAVPGGVYSASVVTE